MKAFTAGINDDGVRLSRFVLRVTHRLPDSLMYKGFRNKRIKVNGRRQPPDYRLRQGDVVELYLSDEFFPEAAGQAAAPAAGALPAYGLVHHQGGVAVLFKPAGVLCHRDAGGEATLLDAFTADMRRQGLYRPEEENTFAPALCNRLDRGTEGLVLAATTAKALGYVNEVIRLGGLEKTYLCICVGAPPEGEHRAFMARDAASRTSRVLAAETAGAKPISTGVKVLERAAGLSLCQVALHTGRTHQIRAHLAFLGAPLWGDRKYGGDAAGATSAPPPPKGQALCAWQLAFAEGLPPGEAFAFLRGARFTAGEARLPKLWARVKGGAP